MSIEDALIARAQNYFLAEKAKALLQQECSKGCQPEIFPQPIALEPPFQSRVVPENLFATEPNPLPLFETPPPPDELRRMQVWISPEQLLDWKRSELFLKQLKTVTHRIGLEIFGNQKKITLSLLCHKNDLPIINAAFQGEFDRCELVPIPKETLEILTSGNWNSVVFNDYYPPPPYSHLFTRPDELQETPFRSLLIALMEMPESAIGYYQALFQPVAPDHNWHLNIQALQDFEYTVKLFRGSQLPLRNTQAAPSGEIHQMASELETKAHNDKPFFALALRVAVVGAGDAGNDWLRSLTTFINLFQHGGCSLQFLPENEYTQHFTHEQIREMFLQGLVYRSGFLVNSRELAGPIHIPSVDLFQFREISLPRLEILPVRHSSLLAGTPIGICRYAGKEIRVCIPYEQRKKHVDLIGKSGVGKSTTMEGMILHDIQHGDGVALLDPHGDMVEHLLGLIPEVHNDRVIYLDFGNPDWVPIWNPFSVFPGLDVGRTADNLVASLKKTVTGWGDRLEHILRHTFYALLSLPDCCLLDVSTLLSLSSPESDRLRREILQVVDNQLSRTFWETDFAQYRKDDLGPPKNKLSKLLLSGRVADMLSQPESYFNFREIMDQGQILLINLATIGSQVLETLGSYILTLLHQSAMSRSNIPAHLRKPFYIFCDEGHRFLTEALEDMIAETRKYAVGLNIAHQYLNQFSQSQINALANVGSTIIFSTDSYEAHQLVKNLQGLVKEEDLMGLLVGQAIVRIGSEIVRIETFPPNLDYRADRKERIITQSHQKYYKPVEEVREIIRRRSGGEKSRRSSPISVPFSFQKNEPFEELVYDEL